jgi:predicted RNase H-related nuclease YkuK (DUF458 family)
MIYEHIIRDFSNNTYSGEELIKNIKDYDKKGYDFFIGSDSQVFGKHISIVTCICPRFDNNDIGLSGRVFYIKDKISKKAYPNLRTRMLLEAFSSIEMALDLDQYINNKISIHLDVGYSKKSKTSNYQSELQYLVKAQGYECEIKPNSWAASGAADRVSKT